jgi:hypothetical protein
VGRDVTGLGYVDILKKDLTRGDYNMGILFIHADVLKKVLNESGL